MHPSMAPWVNVVDRWSHVLHRQGQAQAGRRPSPVTGAWTQQARATVIGSWEVVRRIGSKRALEDTATLFHPAIRSYDPYYPRLPLLSSNAGTNTLQALRSIWHISAPSARLCFPENSFMINLLAEAKPFWKKYFDNNFTNSFIHDWERKIMKRAVKNYFFRASPLLGPPWEYRKRSLTS